MSEFGEADGSHEGIWECPDLFELAVDGNPQVTQWVLKVDIGNAVAGGSGGQYYVGTFDGKDFVNENAPDTILWLDYGKDFYAAQSWSEVYAHQGRNIWVAWMNNWQYANKIPAVTTRGIFSVPRTFSLKSTSKGLRLVQSPIAELEILRKNIFSKSSVQELTENSFAMPKNTLAAEILAEISTPRTQEFSLRLCYGEHEVTTITYSPQKEELSLDRNHSGNVAFHEDFPGKYVAPVSPVDDLVKLRILLDRNTVEVFVHDGEICLSCLIFPSSPLTSIAIDDLLCVQNLAIFQLQK